MYKMKLSRVLKKFSSIINYSVGPTLLHCLLYLAVYSVTLNESKMLIISLKLYSSFPFGPAVISLEPPVWHYWHNFISYMFIGNILTTINEQITRSGDYYNHKSIGFVALR